MATTPVPIAANAVGSLAGLVSGVAVAYLTQAGYLATIATFTGMPVAAVGILAAAIIGAGVNYGVTHYAILKNLDGLAQALPTLSYARTDFPGGKNGQAASPDAYGTTILPSIASGGEKAPDGFPQGRDGA